MRTRRRGSEGGVLKDLLTAAAGSSRSAFGVEKEISNAGEGVFRWEETKKQKKFWKWGERMSTQRSSQSQNARTGAEHCHPL